jgi:hypothetical protein
MLKCVAPSSINLDKKIPTLELVFSFGASLRDRYLRLSIALMAPAMGSDLMETVPSNG